MMEKAPAVTLDTPPETRSVPLAHRPVAALPVAVLLSLFALLVFSIVPLYAQSGQVSVVSVRGPINPVTADYLRQNMKDAGRRRDALLLIEMDTPGGLDHAMRDTVQGIFTSPVPVVVYVAPTGARAASAGAVIALAADVCAMAPGTNIGAAHPVMMGQQPDKVMGEKILNDAEAYVEGLAMRRGRNADLAGKMVRQSISLTAERALQGKVIDFMAADRQELFSKLEGRVVVRDGREKVLHVAGARVVMREMGTRDKVLNAISNPDVAYLLMLLGFVGLFFELSNPGVILPGVIGAISLIMALFAFQSLPVNYAGALMILLALILFIAEIKIVSHGLLAVSGVIALILGSLLLFPSKEPYLRLSTGVLVGTVAFTTVFFLVVIAKVIEAQRQRPITGQEGMLGEHGIADSDIMPDLLPEGRVLVHGEHWSATSTERILKGDRVEVIGISGLTVTVRKLRKREGEGSREAKGALL
jgi:membrane-bound serine protease (ClpP class)